jgi:RNA polymerase sigma-70 factor (ECF subfamily)
MTQPDPDLVTENLLRAAGQGDASARSLLLDRFRDRLKLMVAARLDRRLQARLDPSDVIQDALLQASCHLDQYLRTRPLPFYPWLRQFAWNRLVDLHRQHLAAGKRTARREELLPLSDHSAWDLAGRLCSRDSSPSAHLSREEERAAVRRALDQLPRGDREVLIMRYLERLSVGEIAAVLDVSEGTVSTRTLRALQRLRILLKEVPEEDRP